MYVCTAEQMREIDRMTIEDCGVPGLVLMEAAGRGVADLISELRPAEATVAVLCGGGNNGGDGFVVARHLLSRGATVVTFVVGDPDKLSGDARVNFEILGRIGGDRRSLRTDEELAKATYDITHADVVVDALFGTGLSKPVEGQYRKVIELGNRNKGLKVAVDIPSGLDADTGDVLGVAFAADYTVTFGYPKVGLVSHPGIERVGELHVVDIGVPISVQRRARFAADLLEEESTAARLLHRPVWGHKGTYGHLLVIAGSPGKTGAALLCGEAALRSGLGLCTVAAPERAMRALDAKTVELMVEPLVPEGAALDDSDRVFDHFERLCQGKTAIAVGPGIPREPGVERFIGRLVRQSPLPMVIDADGLNYLAGQVEVLREARVPVLLTPHPGEMARLTGLPSSEIQADRLKIACRYAVDYDVHLALKGSRTVIASPDGKAFINPTGNSGLGSAGTGDVLTGLVGGFLGQRQDPSDALILGVYLHGTAGDRAAADYGQRSLLASDLLVEVAEVLKTWQA